MDLLSVRSDILNSTIWFFHLICLEKRASYVFQVKINLEASWITTVFNNALKVLAKQKIKQNWLKKPLKAKKKNTKTNIPNKTKKGSRESQNVLTYICENIFYLPLTQNLMFKKWVE